MWNMIEVTSLNRPDTSWRVTDRHGHTHQWYSNEAPAERYSPQDRYTLPTLIRITDDEGDDEHPGTFHYECRDCHERIQPRTCADSERQFIRGLRY